MKQLILDMFDPWMILGIHVPLFFCAWIGCWVATFGMRRPSKFLQTLARGMAGGAVGGFLNPMLVLMYVNALIMGPTPNRVQALQALPLLLAEGAVLSLPFAIFIAIRKRHEPPVASVGTAT